MHMLFGKEVSVQVASSVCCHTKLLCHGQSVIFEKLQSKPICARQIEDSTRRSVSFLFVFKGLASWILLLGICVPLQAICL